MTTIKTVAITGMPQQSVKWVQFRLATGGYYKGKIDGVAGPNTIAALAKFKQEAYLEHPLMVGVSTLDALEALDEPDSVSEQPRSPSQSPNPDAGQKRGKSIVLPLVGKIYEHQWIVEDGYMTWGEATKGFSRVPVAHQAFGSVETIVRNAITLAKAVRTVRHKVGKPIQFTSVYRPPHLKIGAARSQHKRFLGCDMAPLNDNPRDWATLIECIKATPEFKGIGIAGPRLGFWHADCRVGGRVIFPYK